MKQLIDILQFHLNGAITFEKIGEIVAKVAQEQFDYDDFLPEIVNPKKYARRTLTLDPIEVSMLHWPPGAASAVHHHEGFFGYVLCLEGTIENTTFRFQGGTLYEDFSLRALPGGWVREPDGVIHRISNPSAVDRLVTLHFYYPAIQSLDGILLFDLEHKRMGRLNAEAKSASFEEPLSAFHAITHDAFDYKPLGDSQNTHQLFPIVPKPNAETISSMVDAYYQEQAVSYDAFDQNMDFRRKYNEAINIIIADHIKGMDEVHRVVDLACGTGRRALDIRERTQLNYALCGIDLSAEMIEVAQARGLEARRGNWTDVDIPAAYASAVTFLYACGHIPTETARRKSLAKIHRTLRPGGLLFFDVFNVHDPNEWGPQAVEAYEREQLADFGYEMGDIFYRKRGREEVAFLHYFTEEQLRAVLEETGFEIVKLIHVGYRQHAGQILENKAGCILTIARKIG
jgi:SAM-dependent methyltransferase/predicted metal-dependent enzyme (double-stranded beta helix superfamily)